MGIKSLLGALGTGVVGGMVLYDIFRDDIDKARKENKKKMKEKNKENIIDVEVEPAKTTKVFISIPMRDKTNFEIMTDIEKAKNEIRKRSDFKDIKNLEFVDSFRPDNKEKSTPKKLLAESLNLLADCDYVYFDVNWEKYRGCKVEHYFAEKYNIPII